MVLTAPAKLNLLLEVTGRRDNGYHEISTLFERISLCDEILVELSDKNTSIRCDSPDIPTDENSLLGKTVRAFREESHKADNFDITIKKNIPVGAGLGGGSSDAASLLKGLNEITGSPLDHNTLLRVSGGLGADVPFFLSDCRFALGKGRGDIITNVENGPDLWHVLVNPSFEVSTREVYGKVSAFGLTKEKGVDRMMTAFLLENDIDSVAKNLRNDLQAIVLREFPVLEKVFGELKAAGAKGTLMSGSGPSVFGIFDEDQAEKAADRIKKILPLSEGWRVYVVHAF